MNKKKVLIIVIIIILLIIFGIWFFTKKERISNKEQIDKILNDMHIDVLLAVENYNGNNSFKDKQLAQYIFSALLEEADTDENGDILFKNGFAKNNGEYPEEMYFVAKPDDMEKMAKELFNVDSNSKIWNDVKQVNSLVSYDSNRNVYYTIPAGGILPTIQIKNVEVYKKDANYFIKVGYNELSQYADVEEYSEDELLGSYIADLKLKYNENADFFKFTLLSIEKKSIKNDVL